ncbi:hypothetical protein [Streptosporangium sandarakinum]|uniref:Uncharacterized protein n=1 Tax=Streptosporangium sandarakinum TaxID=1260955 RepID=A0A852V2M1_9ACTN|nr:hypothetical protein [Streptosporangium sandarakinum]NYF41593.1 hypothetical protein [Streptosporangium sandarakinum]
MCRRHRSSSRCSTLAIGGTRSLAAEAGACTVATVRQGPSVVALLLSPDAAWLTGQNLTADGGLV